MEYRKAKDANKPKKPTMRQITLDSFAESIKSVSKELLDEVWFDAVMAANIPFHATEQAAIEQAIYMTQVC